MALRQLPLLRVVRFRPGSDLFDVLSLEERLYRTKTGNWLVTSSGRNEPDIVMGISTQPVDVLELGELKRAQPPARVIRRFTGGGTVVIDEGTALASLILNADDVGGGLKPYPRDIMAWSAELYAPVWASVARPEVEPFVLNEHDYCFGSRKFGGNAQSISGRRFVHHTSFLGEIDPAKMKLLSMPPDKIRPDYRLDREHGDFLTDLRTATTLAEGWEPRQGTLGDHVSRWLSDSLAERLEDRFDVITMTPEAAAEFAEQQGPERPYRQRNSVLSGSDLEAA